MTVHEVGVHEGQHYLVMNFVNGPPLSRLVADGPLDPTRASSYLKRIAEAVHYAHENGIMHRDLKPSNVMIDADDQPQITDFGLAKRLDGESSLTLTGQALGSPGYMPPEQALAEHSKVTRRSDVYGLGGVLWQWNRPVANEQMARQNAYAADMKVAQQTLEDGDLGTALDLPKKHRPESPDQGLRG